MDIIYENSNVMSIYYQMFDMSAIKTFDNEQFISFEYIPDNFKPIDKALTSTTFSHKGSGQPSVRPESPMDRTNS